MDKYFYLTPDERNIASDIVKLKLSVDEAAKKLRLDGVEQVSAVRVLRVVYDLPLMDAHQAFGSQ